jgi:hypothetical protein
VQLFGLFIGATAFEFLYVAWARAAAVGRPHVVTAYSVAVAALGLAGVGGALHLEHGVITYLAGIAAGAYSSALIEARRRTKPGV